MTAVAATAAKTVGRDLDAEDMLSINLKTAAGLVRLLGEVKHFDPNDMSLALGAVDLAMDQALLGLEGVQAVLDRAFPPTSPEEQSEATAGGGQ